MLFRGLRVSVLKIFANFIIFVAKIIPSFLLKLVIKAESRLNKEFIKISEDFLLASKTTNLKNYLIFFNTEVLWSKYKDISLQNNNMKLQQWTWSSELIVIYKSICEDWKIPLWEMSKVFHLNPAVFRFLFSKLDNPL